MSPVKAIPDEFHSVTPHIVVDDAAKAIEFYKKAFGAVEICRLPGPDGKIMHAEIKIGNSIVMLGEAFEKSECSQKSPKKLGGTPVTLHIYVEKADKTFDQAVSAGATVTMPLEDMFWGDRYGRVQDPFGHEWSIATHIKDMKPEEMALAAKEACKV